MNAKTLITALVLFGMAPTQGSASELPEVLKRSFVAKGQAGLDRLEQDPTQKACSQAGAVTGAAAAEIIAANQASIRYPSDGQWLGDWRAGEAIAQRGTGKQFSDDPTEPSGGNCYACHQLAPDEIAYGTIGPSLKAYGKLRGRGEAVLRYTWGKIYNPQAYFPCSGMPRFGHQQILTEQQIRDVMALLFDPESPVNRDSSP
ncbi:sulfur oxidation c-type cytochrome SoxX [Sinimarinibacterium thermocellulolyticum]|uniref:Sulfur oxidation c-type cytochrome SoxX n=1 Tax=Sinimarinibacterium thermocellulolyticum TaxID=3170016 RepID=A0ABV2ABU8_9GAMM